MVIHVEQRRGTLCYLAPRADGDHAPERLLERRVHVKTAKTVGQMLQEDTRRDDHRNASGVECFPTARTDWDLRANCLFTHSFTEKSLDMQMSKLFSLHHNLSDLLSHHGLLSEAAWQRYIMKQEEA